MQPQLQPSIPPGHGKRKARSFQLEIARLRDEGYSLDAIRMALTQAGVCVSRSTVYREAVRPRTARDHIQTSTVRSPSTESAALVRVISDVQTPAAPPSVGVGATPFGGDSRHGRDIAAEFFARHISNPLIRARGQR